MTTSIKILKVVSLLFVIAALSIFLYREAAPLFASPCKEPIPYSLSLYDARFDISKERFKQALHTAVGVWEKASGRDLFVEVPEGGIRVSMLYGEKQQVVELGETISAEQTAYDATKAELETIKQQYNAARRIYENHAAVYDEASTKYHAEVAKWNSRGGAPEAEYEKLEATRKDLEDGQRELKEEAERLNKLVLGINTTVDELNRLARMVNAKVDIYNEGAGVEFEQGEYTENTEGKRIVIYEFSDTSELERVLAHEFGHALGIGHVENPNSVMYSYNAGDDLVLSEEDRAALRTACKLD